MTGQLALIAIGSNDASRWGDPGKTVVEAARRVAELDVSVSSCSPLYATPAFPAGSGPDFVNAAIAIQYSHGAQPLLDALHGIERDADRQRAGRWTQRTLDLDLLACGETVLPDAATVRRWMDMPLSVQMHESPEQLILPHPRLQDRAFVLVPLMDVAPDWCHPILGRSVRQMYADLAPDDIASVQRIGRPERSSGGLHVWENWTS